MEFKRWDVVAVHYPFVEGTEAKKRPGLIVSDGRLVSAHGLYWVVMITTAKAGVKPDDIPVTNPRSVGLPDDCVIRVPRLTSLGKMQISHILGSITTKDRTAVASLLKRFCP